MSVANGSINWFSCRHVAPLRTAIDGRCSNNAPRVEWPRRRSGPLQAHHLALRPVRRPHEAVAPVPVCRLGRGKCVHRALE
jgi:hypothetical protein